MYLFGMDSQVVDLEWGIVLVIVPICERNINRILLQAQINKIDKVKVVKIYNPKPYRTVSQPC